MLVSDFTRSFWATGVGAAAATMRNASLVRPAPWVTASLTDMRPVALFSLDASHRRTCVTSSAWVSASKISCGMGERYRPAGSGARGDPWDRRARAGPVQDRLVGVERAGDQGKEVPEHGPGGAPDGVADDLEEVDRPVLRRDAPAFLPEDPVAQQLRQRHVQDELDLPRGGLERRPA